ncbi:hypothetical protein [Streptomyces sp. SID12501]|uniref:Transcriptional regulator n=1 Tax=Streptomyces sp. SID12501 TaxID=2706042 RepID=A0A6B3BPV6_9ACTN|nr:hypothetical protein [Streptomyces sp. SID12501]NEC86373.1 hypothetical protein [Streptomyces sp. SID12501]
MAEDSAPAPVPQHRAPFHADDTTPFAPHGPGTSRGPNLRLRALLAEAGWTHEVLARSVNRLATLRGMPSTYSRATVARWLAGSLPRHPARQLILGALSDRLGRPVSAFAAGFGPPTDPHRATAASDPVALLCDLSGAESDLTMRASLRGLPHDVGASVPSPSGPDIILVGPDRAARETDWSARTGFLQSLAHASFRDMDALGGAVGRTSVAVLLSEHASAWLGDAADTAAFPALAVATARLTHVLAQMHADAGSEGLAQRYHHIAVRLADRAGDPVTRALGLRALSVQALRLGHLGLARNLAESAAEYQGPAAVRAFLLAQLSVVRAWSGDRRGAVHTLSRAERHVLRAWSSDATAEPFTTYSPSAFAYQKAETLAALGDRTGAVTALHAALNGRGPAPSRGRALARARAAELHCAGGELDMACAHWESFLHEAPQIASRQVLLRAERMLRRLNPYHRHSAARSLVERAAALHWHGQLAHG